MSIRTMMMRTLALTICSGSAILFVGCAGSSDPTSSDPADPSASAAPEEVGQAKEALGNCPPTGLLSPTGGPSYPGSCIPLLPPALQALIDGALTPMITDCAAFCGQSTAACVSPINSVLVSATTFCFNQDGAHRYVAACVCNP